MWNWFNCYLSGRHDYGVWCASGAIFLRCVHCGKRSSGLTIDAKLEAPVRTPPAALVPVATVSRPSNPRVLPFTRVAAR